MILNFKIHIDRLRIYLYNINDLKNKILIVINISSCAGLEIISIGVCIFRL